MPSVPREPRKRAPDLSGPEYDKLWDALARLWRSAERNGWQPRRSVPATPLSSAVSPSDDEDER
jgi:hypothetical protein